MCFSISFSFSLTLSETFRKPSLPIARKPPLRVDAAGDGAAVSLARSLVIRVVGAGIAPVRDLVEGLGVAVGSTMVFDGLDMLLLTCFAGNLSDQLLSASN